MSADLFVGYALQRFLQCGRYLRGHTERQCDSGEEADSAQHVFSRYERAPVHG